MRRQIVVYHQPDCPPCHQAMDFLTRHGVPFEARDVREDPTAMAELVALGFHGTPVLVIDGVPYPGFIPQRVAELLGLDRGAADGPHSAK